MDNDDNGNHLDLAVPSAALTLARCGYVLVAAPVTSICAGLADTPGAALVTYSLLLLGVAFISLSVLLPRRPTERVLEEEENRAVLGGNLQGDEAVLPDAGTIAWCGYLLVAAPVLASWTGLADTPVAAVFAYALLLLGAAFVNLAMVLPRPVERVLEEENRGVGNGNHQASEVLLAATAGTIAWSGYLLVAAPVLASWAGLVDGPVASFVVYALLLLGVAFIGYAMLAPAKPKIA